MLRTFGQLLYNILQRESIILQDIALKCYMRLAGPLRLNFYTYMSLFVYISCHRSFQRTDIWKSYYWLSLYMFRHFHRVESDKDSVSLEEQWAVIGEEM